MQILPAQMLAFSKAAHEAFIDRLGRRMHESFPQVMAQRQLDEAGVAHACRRVVDMAASHGIHDEQDVTTFFDCVMLLGPAFDRDPRLPWAAATLQRSDLSGAQKMALIHDHIVFGLRA